MNMNKHHIGKAILALVMVLALVILTGCSTPAANTNNETPQGSNVATGNWPERPINVVVGFGAGGFTDLVARNLASLMAEDLGVSIPVSNMPGATGGIAADFVQHAPNDGHTILGCPESLRLLAVMGYHETLIGKDWMPLIAASFDGVISVKDDSPIKDFKQLVEKARSNPNSIKFGASSPGTVWHLQSQILTRKANVPMQFIPYNGSAPAQTAAIGGEVEMVHTGIGEQAELLRAGQLRPLAVFSDKPYELEGVGIIPPVTDVLPELASYMPFNCWIGYAIPTSVPEEICKQIEASYLKAVNDERFFAFVKSLEGEVLGYDLEKSLEVGKEQTSSVGWLVHEFGLSVNSPEKYDIPKPSEE